MYLLDTNIILELLLEQEKAEDVEQFLKRIPSNQFYLSQFSLYSLGIILLRYKKPEVFLQIVDDLLITGGVRIAHLDPAGMAVLVQTAAKFRLDFDDAFQYLVSENYDLTLVSFDADFDRTPRGRKTPEQILKNLDEHNSKLS